MNNTPSSFANKRAAVVTLGCAKNQVDSEILLGLLGKAGFEIVADPRSAEVVVVNTCGFIQSAVEENVDTILELAELKQHGKLQRLIVAGCLVARYGAELRDSLPEVDAFIAPHDIPELLNVITGQNWQVSPGDAFLYDNDTPRLVQPGSVWSYIKVAEGCNRSCSFCTIPAIRGQFHSRSMESIAKEADQLIANGVRELTLVAQDTTAYGQDWGQQNAEPLVKLLSVLAKQHPDTWLRILYAYPSGVTPALLDMLSSGGPVCPYLDLPLQHCVDSVLQRMRRPLGTQAPRKLVEMIRQKYPKLALRTGFIVGFPGETEQDFLELLEFVEAGHFLSVGVFRFSAEDGTLAAAMPLQVPDEVREERWNRLMIAQRDISSKYLNSLQGSEIDVLIEGRHPDTDLLWQGRAMFQAPEVDGTVIVNDVEPGSPVIDSGAMVKVRITASSEYDIIGTIIGPGVNNGEQ